VARLLDPTTRPHEVSDDLESFFWVLLYLVVKCRNAVNADFSRDMQDVFDQHTDMDRDGIVKGGKGKLSCLRQVYFHPKTVKALVKTPCRNIIEELRSLFHASYVDFNPDLDLADDTSESDPAEMEDAQDPRAKDAYEKLRSSEWVLSLIDGHLASRWDTDNDGSLYKTELRPDPSASRNRRKRKAPDSKDDRETYNTTRKGRLPPAIPRPSGDSFWSQGLPRSHSKTRTLVSTSSHGAPRTSKRSLPSRTSKLKSGTKFV